MDDRTRLKEVRQTDLTEGRINQDFLDWLQNKGMTWLLMLLVALCVYLGLVRWRGHKVSHQAEAWKAFRDARLPSDFDDVAEKYAGIDSVAQLAQLRAGREFLTAVQADVVISAADTQPSSLSDEQREQYLKNADDLFAKVVAADDQSQPRTLLAVQALNGRAAVAESRGQLDQAKTLYEQAAQRAEATFPELARQSREYAKSAAEQTRVVSLPSQADLAHLGQPSELMMRMTEPPSMENWVRDLLMPNDSSG
jgi:hypothetical protein